MVRLFLEHRLLLLDRADAIEYLSSSREAWKSQAEENELLGIADAEGGADDDAEDEKNAWMLRSMLD